MVELLIAGGADVSAETNEGNTPLDYALVAGRDEIAALLQEAPTTPGSEGEKTP